MSDKRDWANYHIDRCVECYSTPFETDGPVARETFEQMRADLMIAVGILMAIYSVPQGESE